MAMCVGIAHFAHHGMKAKVVKGISSSMLLIPINGGIAKDVEGMVGFKCF